MDAVVLPLVVGAGVGLVVGTLGGGGGILTVPILVYLLDQRPQVAATSALVIVGITSLVAMVGHARRGQVRWAEGTAFGLLGSVAAYLGAFASLSVDETLLMGMFTVLLLVVAVVMLHRSWLHWHGRHKAAGSGRRGPARQHSPPRADWSRVLRVLLLASAVGLLTGFFGVGGGFAAVPALVLALGFGMRPAVGTSLLVIALNSAVGLGVRLAEGVSVDWVLVAVFTATSSLAGVLGSRLSARTRPHVLSASFGILLAAVSVVTAVQAFPDLLG